MTVRLNVKFSERQVICILEKVKEQEQLKRVREAQGLTVDAYDVASWKAIKRACIHALAHYTKKKRSNPREPSNIGTARAVLNAEADRIGDAQEEMARQRALGMVFPKTIVKKSTHGDGSKTTVTMSGYDVDELFQSPLYDDEMIASMGGLTVDQVASLRAQRKATT